MKHAVALLSALCGLALVVALCGCGGSGVPVGSAGPSVGTAAKPSKPPPLPPPDSTGWVYFYPDPYGTLHKVDSTGQNTQNLNLDSQSYCVSDVGVHGDTPFIIWVKALEFTPGHIVPRLHVCLETGTEDRDLTFDSTGEDWWTADAALSRDGTRIALVAGKYDPELMVDWESGIYVADVTYEGGLPAPIDMSAAIPVVVVEGEDACGPSWSPDNQYLVYERWPVEGIRTDVDVYKVDMETKATTLVVDTSMSFTYPAPDWSPVLSDGSTRIAFAQEVRNKGGKITGIEIRTVKPDGTGLKVVASLTNTGFDRQQGPSWSPDGACLAFHAWSSTGGDAHLMKIGAEGTTSAATLAPTSAHLLPIWWRP